MRLQRPKLPQPSEEVVQAHITGALRSMGYTVLSTVHRVKLVRCPHCAHQLRPPGAYGADHGVSDLIVTHAKYPPGVFIALEVKSATGLLTPRQKELAAAEMIHVVRSVADALAAVKETEKWLMD